MEELMEKLSAAVLALEAAALRLGERESLVAAAAEERVAHITATAASEREQELAVRLEEAEATMAEMRAAAELQASGGRRTAVTSAKFAAEPMDASALDAAMGSLSIEQRFAVKAEMLRAGMLR